MYGVQTASVKWMNVMVIINTKTANAKPNWTEPNQSDLSE